MHLPEYGLGGQGEFGACHPLVNAGFFFAAAGITMFSMSPVFLGLSLAASASYATMLQGWRSLGKTWG